MKAVTMADDLIVNILAFFKVVASSQISPHLFFSGGKDSEKYSYGNFSINKSLNYHFKKVKIDCKIF